LFTYVHILYNEMYLSLLVVVDLWSWKWLMQ